MIKVDNCIFYFMLISFSVFILVQVKYLWILFLLKIGMFLLFFFSNANVITTQKYLGIAFVSNILDLNWKTLETCNNQNKHKHRNASHVHYRSEKQNQQKRGSMQLKRENINISTINSSNTKNRSKMFLILFLTFI